MIESEFYQALTSVTDKPAYALVLPVNAKMPCTDYSIIGGSTSATFDGHGTATYRIEVNCWASDYTAAVTLRNQVIAGLDGLRTDTLTIRVISPRDFFERDLNSFRAMVEFYVYRSI